MKKTTVTRLALLTGAISALALAACKQPAPPRTELVLGTVCTINLFEEGTDERYSRLVERLREIDRHMSANRDDSTIARINAAAGSRAVPADPETLTVLSAALAFAEKSGGLFDPTIGPLVKLWDIGGESPAVPEPRAIDDARALIDWKKVRVDETAGTVFLEQAGMRLDLGAIAKGWAADELARIIREWGIERAIIDLGGNIYALGSKDSQTPWHIGIRNPELSGGAPVISLHAVNRAMVTSGLNERFFMENGTRYHHILNPETGFPADTDVLSVSILAERALDADALSTILFLMGSESGLKFIEEIPDAEAVYITTSREVRVSSGLQGKILVRNDRFTLAAD